MPTSLALILTRRARRSPFRLSDSFTAAFSALSLTLSCGKRSASLDHSLLLRLGERFRLLLLSRHTILRLALLSQPFSLLRLALLRSSDFASLLLPFLLSALLITLTRDTRRACAYSPPVYADSLVVYVQLPVGARARAVRPPSAQAPLCCESGCAPRSTFGQPSFMIFDEVRLPFTIVSVSFCG